MILFYFTRCQLLQESWKLLTYNWLQTKWQLTLYAVCVRPGACTRPAVKLGPADVSVQPLWPNRHEWDCLHRTPVHPMQAKTALRTGIRVYTPMWTRPNRARECHQHTMDHTVGPKALFNDHIVTANSNASEPRRTPSSGMWWGLTGAQDSCKQHIN